MSKLQMQLNHKENKVKKPKEDERLDLRGGGVCLTGTEMVEEARRSKEKKIAEAVEIARRKVSKGEILKLKQSWKAAERARVERIKYGRTNHTTEKETYMRMKKGAKQKKEPFSMALPTKFITEKSLPRAWLDLEKDLGDRQDEDDEREMDEDDEGERDDDNE